MKRRQFLYAGALTGLSFVTLKITGCKSGTEKAIVSETAPTGFQLEEITISELQQKLSSGDFTSSSLTQIYLDEINRIDKNGPALNSIIEINPDALAIAGQMDEERKNNKVRGPLHGIPVLIKDNIDTADNMQTTAGALALSGNKAKSDAFVVKKLREAGAVILGKTNLSEWANFRSTRSSSGWSSRGGQTKNPYLLDRSPCGSSSGSAVAVAANLCVVAVGTETDGSIACPASINGIVGIKPTVGLVSRTGIIPISHTQDTAGPFGRTVSDAAILLGAMTGIDPADKVTEESQGKSHSDYTRFLQADGLKGKKIGIEKSLLKVHEGVDALLASALEHMKTAGATIIEVEFMKKNREIGDAEFEMMLFEFKAGVNNYLANANAQVKSLDDVIRFNKENEAKAMPYFKQELLEQAVAKGGLDSKEYKDALKTLFTGRKFLDDLIAKNQLDALCAPATGTSWCIDPINGDYWTGYGGYSIAAKTGYPSITVPMGMLMGLPLGLSFISKPYDEPGLISIGYAFEQLTKHRIKPGFLPAFKS